jgi:hypothetical protein
MLCLDVIHDRLAREAASDAHAAICVACEHNRAAGVASVLCAKRAERLAVRWVGDACPDGRWDGRISSAALSPFVSICIGKRNDYKASVWMALVASGRVEGTKLVVSREAYTAALKR